MAYNGYVGTYYSWKSSSTLPVGCIPRSVNSYSIASGSIPSGMSISTGCDTLEVYVVLSGIPSATFSGNLVLRVNYTYTFGIATKTGSGYIGFENISIVNPPTYTHTIYYNANGGSGSMGATTVTNANSGNTNVTFASNGFSAPTGHYFAGWRINNTGTVYQPGNTYPVGGNGSVTAYAYWLPNSYTVSLTAGTGGTVSGGGTYNYGSSCTITATPNSGYKFTKWSDNNTSASRTFTVTGNVSLTAYFELDAVQVTGASNGNGSVTGSGQYNIGSTATLTAVPDTHYKFIKWNDDTTTNPKVFTVTQAVTYTATFGWAYPNMPVKVNGSWVDGTPYVKVNGSWVKATKVWINDNGTWKESTLK